MPWCCVTLRETPDPRQTTRPKLGGERQSRFHHSFWYFHLLQGLQGAFSIHMCIEVNHWFSLPTMCMLAGQNLLRGFEASVPSCKVLRLPDHELRLGTTCRTFPTWTQHIHHNTNVDAPRWFDFGTCAGFHLRRAQRHSCSWSGHQTTRTWPAMNSMETKARIVTTGLIGSTIHPHFPMAKGIQRIWMRTMRIMKSTVCCVQNARKTCCLPSTSSSGQDTSKSPHSSAIGVSLWYHVPRQHHHTSSHLNHVLGIRIYSSLTTEIKIRKIKG